MSTGGKLLSAEATAGASPQATTSAKTASARIAETMNPRVTRLLTGQVPEIDRDERRGRTPGASERCDSLRRGTSGTCVADRAGASERGERCGGSSASRLRRSEEHTSEL